MRSQSAGLLVVVLAWAPCLAADREANSGVDSRQRRATRLVFAAEPLPEKSPEVQSAVEVKPLDPTRSMGTAQKRMAPTGRDETRPARQTAAPGTRKYFPRMTISDRGAEFTITDQDPPEPRPSFAKEPFPAALEPPGPAERFAQFPEPAAPGPTLPQGPFEAPTPPRQLPEQQPAGTPADIPTSPLLESPLLNDLFETPSGSDTTGPDATGNAAEPTDTVPPATVPPATVPPRSAEDLQQPEAPQSPFDFSLDNALLGQVGLGTSGAGAGDLSPPEAGPIASVPPVIGDFFDGGTHRVQLRVPVTTSFFTNGQRIATNPDVFAFERDGVGFPDDFFTVGPGIDTNGDGLVDTYAISEPLPPNDVPTSPGSEFTFDGGTVAFTNSQSTTTPPVGVPIPVPGTSIWFASYSFSELVEELIPSTGGGVAVRRFKVAENNSPLPQDRVFWNYSFFNDVLGGLGDVSRHTLGMEKTYFRGRASWEFRIPFAATLDNDQNVGQIGARGFEFGNAMFTWKSLLMRTDRQALAGGLGITLPVARDSSLYLADGQRVLLTRNEAVHFLPYLAGSRVLGERGFVESFVQFDFDPYGNPVFASASPTATNGLPRIGRLNDASLLFVDATVGYWLYQNDQANWLNGAATVAEFHYSTTLNDADTVFGNGVAVTELSPRVDVLNLTLGTHLKMRSRGRIAAGMSLPLRSGHDAPFDYEFILQMNRLF